MFHTDTSFCHERAKPFILEIQCRRPLIFETMDPVRLNSLNMKYQRFTLSGCKDMRIRKLEFVAKLNSFIRLNIRNSKPFHSS